MTEHTPSSRKQAPERELDSRDFLSGMNVLVCPVNPNRTMTHFYTKQLMSVHYNAETKTTFENAYLEVSPGKRYGLAISTSPENEERFTARLEINGVEHTRVGFLSGQKIKIASRRCSEMVEQHFVFSEQETVIKLEIWRTQLQRTFPESVFYNKLDHNHPANGVSVPVVRNSPQSMVMRIKYLDKHPAYVYTFVCLQKSDLERVFEETALQYSRKAYVPKATEFSQEYLANKLTTMAIQPREEDEQPPSPYSQDENGSAKTKLVQ